MTKARSIGIISICISLLFAAAALGQSEDPYARIQPLLDDTTAVLVYDVGGMKVDVVRSGSVVTRALGKTEEPLETKLDFFVDILESLDPMIPYQGESAALYTILIKPVTGDLSGITRLGIVPGRKLAGLSFAALISNPSPKRSRFLIDDYALFYAPSLEMMERALETDKSALVGGIVIGNAKYPAGYGVLKMAELEMKEVVTYVPGAVMYEGEAAGESTLKERLAEAPLSVLHFTTHDVIKPGSDDGSKIILSGGGNDDGNLTVTEVSSMKMDVDLVTISADRAGLVWGPSYGFVGAFLSAGAASVLAPLYRVDKGMTANLMSAFYMYLPDHDKAEALRQAQLAIIDLEKDKGRFRFGHPGYWAPFVLFGSYR
jgi:CHAT domain-containing protein